MKVLAENIVSIIGEYRREDGLNIDVNHVLRWCKQFEEKDQKFMLTELLHILPKTYFSKEKILNSFYEAISLLTKKYKSKNEISFLSHTYFVECQSKEKSQSEILSLFYNSVTKKYGIDKSYIGSKSKK